MIRSSFFLSAIFLPLLVSSCAGVGEQWLTGLEASAAKDQIMLIRRDPPSFGYQRLSTQAHAYPDLGIFVQQNGLPDFLGEAANRDQRYLFLYYLNERHAYACRTKSPRSRAVEFTGPYPITKREYEILNGFRSASETRRVSR
jgi:hypothetical protein